MVESSKNTSGSPNSSSDTLSDVFSSGCFVILEDPQSEDRFIVCAYTSRDGLVYIGPSSPIES